MELLFHMSIIMAMMAVSLAGMSRTISSFQRNHGPMPSEFTDYPEAEDRFLVDPLNVDKVLSFGPRAPQGNSVGFPWNPRAMLNHPQQSPIDICSSNCLQSKKYKALRIEYATTAQTTGIKVEIINSGHGIELKIPRKEARPIFSGGMLPNRYIMDNIHLHWGRDNNLGSEHFIDGEAYAMECHVVTYNTKYKDINEALQNKDDGVFVFTFFFKVTTDDNNRLESFLKYVPEVRENKAIYSVADQGAFLWFLEAAEKNQEYITYPGSLTTPPYTEAVVFGICTTPLGVSSSQIYLLRTLMDKENKPVLSNRREIQSLNKRPIYCLKGPIKIVKKEISPESSNDV